MTSLKILATCLLTLFMLNACSSEVSQSVPAEVSTAGVGSPSTSTNALPDADTAAKIDFEFTPAADKQIIYFNSQSQAVSDAAAGGYYREIIGQTADGRMVAQDFYQDIGKPQTQPFILQKGADPHDFSSDTMDSKGVWFRPDGSLFQVQDFRAGKAAGSAWFFENGQTIAQINENTDQIDFYQNGVKIAVWQANKAEQSMEMSYFRTDGSIAIRLILKNGEFSNAQAWSATGESIPPAKVRDEIASILMRADQIFAAIRQDSSFVMGEAGFASQPNNQASQTQ